VFFRFAAGLMLVVMISMVGIRLEKQTLEMRRAVSVQYFQTDLLLEVLVRLRLESQTLTAQAQQSLIAENVRTTSRAAGNEKASQRPRQNRTSTADSEMPSLQLLRLQQPFDPRGID
jgi:hypothetical protein